MIEPDIDTLDGIDSVQSAADTVASDVADTDLKSLVMGPLKATHLHEHLDLSLAVFFFLFHSCFDAVREDQLYRYQAS